MDRPAQVGVIAIRQAGSAAAFAPLVRRLRAVRPERPIEVFCYGPARATWERTGLAYQPVDSFDDAGPLLDAIAAPAFVLTGTSLAVADDARWWAWAKSRRCRSFAFVDQWVNYWQRFALSAEGGPHFDCMPDRIAVVDDVAAARIAAYGCPVDRVVVAGSPAFDQLLEIDARRVQGLRERFTDHGRAALIVFACEPATPPQTSADIKRRFGFCEEEAIGLLAAAAADTAARLSRQLHVVFKPHPIQIAQGTRPTVRSHDERFVTFSCFEGDRLELVAAADVVVGMRSMLLYEAALAGRPVVSVQPQRLESCDLTDGRAGIEIVGSESALRQALFERLVDTADPRDVNVPGTMRHAADAHSQRFAETLELV